MVDRIPSSQANRPRLRVLAALFAFATLASQLSSLVHVANTQHVTCAEHGESIELSGVTDGEGHHHVGSCLRESSDASPHHDHCVVASVRRERTTCTSYPAQDVSGALRPGAVPLVPATARDARTIAIISLAPKNSPPV